MIKKIGIFGFFGYGNLGNAATQDAMIENIRRYQPDAVIFGFSLNPEDTQARHGIVSFPIIRRRGHATVAGQLSTTLASKPNLFAAAKSWLRKAPRFFAFLKRLRKPLDYLEHGLEEVQFWRDSYKVLKSIDLFIISGGGALDDFWGGAWSHPYTIFKWAVLARMAGSRVFVVSVGAEAMESRLSKFFIRRGLAFANYRSFRDEESRRQVEKMGVQGTNHVFPDLAFSLRAAENYGRKAGGRFRGLVAIGAMAHLDPRSWPKKDSAGYFAYVQKLVGFAAWLMEREYAVCLFPSEIYMDHAVIQDVMKLLRQANLCDDREQIFENRVSTVADLLHQLAAADFVVASRLHGVILSHVVGTPALAVSYEPKVDRVMRNLGLSDYCMNIDCFDLASLTERFCFLESNQQTIRKLVAEKTAEYRTALTVQYESIFKVRNEELSSVILSSEEGSATSPARTKVG